MVAKGFSAVVYERTTCTPVDSAETVWWIRIKGINADIAAFVNAYVQE